MNPREWFVLGIRLFGIWCLTRGVTQFASFADLRFHLSGSLPDMKPNAYLYYAAWDFVLAAYFLLGARHLAGICERGGADIEHGEPTDKVCGQPGVTDSDGPEVR
jgi:hypothetical protein